VKGRPPHAQCLWPQQRRLEAGCGAAAAGVGHLRGWEMAEGGDSASAARQSAAPVCDAPRVAAADSLGWPPRARLRADPACALTRSAGDAAALQQAQWARARRAGPEAPRAAGRRRASRRRRARAPAEPVRRPVQTARADTRGARARRSRRRSRRACR